jgi:hypothetical protein
MRKTPAKLAIRAASCGTPGCVRSGLALVNVANRQPGLSHPARFAPLRRKAHASWSLHRSSLCTISVKPRFSEPFQPLDELLRAHPVPRVGGRPLDAPDKVGIGCDGLFDATVTARFARFQTTLHVAPNSGGDCITQGELWNNAPIGTRKTKLTLSVKLCPLSAIAPFRDPRSDSPPPTESSPTGRSTATTSHALP